MGRSTANSGQDRHSLSKGNDRLLFQPVGSAKNGLILRSLPTPSILQYTPFYGFHHCTYAIFYKNSSRSFSQEWT
jgi:hypothetical protein